MTDDCKSMWKEEAKLKGNAAVSLQLKNVTDLIQVTKGAMAGGNGR